MFELIKYETNLVVQNLNNFFQYAPAQFDSRFILYLIFQLHFASLIYTLHTCAHVIKFRCIPNGRSVTKCYAVASSSTAS